MARETCKVIGPWSGEPCNRPLPCRLHNAEPKGCPTPGCCSASERVAALEAENARLAGALRSQARAALADAPADVPRDPPASEALRDFFDAWDAGALTKHDVDGVLGERLWQAAEQLRDATLIGPEVREAIRWIASRPSALEFYGFGDQRTNEAFATLRAAGLLDENDDRAEGGEGMTLTKHDVDGVLGENDDRAEGGEGMTLPIGTTLNYDGTYGEWLPPGPTGCAAYDCVKITNGKHRGMFIALVCRYPHVAGQLDCWHEGPIRATAVETIADLPAVIAAHQRTCG